MNWWQCRRIEFHCINAAETLAEGARGDAEQARRRLAVVAGLTIVPSGLEAEPLTIHFLASGALPARARSDGIASWLLPLAFILLTFWEGLRWLRK